MYKVYYSFEARKNLLEIQNFIASDNLIKSIEIIKYLKDFISQLNYFPYLGSPYKTTKIRKLVSPKYNFIIFYEINQKQIEIKSISKYKLLF